MNQFTKYIEWEDEWYFKPSQQVDYGSFEKLNYVSWGKRKAIKTRIEGREEVDHPSELQAKTFDFIIEHQEEIRASIFDVYQKVIHPMYDRSIDIEEDEIAYSLEDLNKVFGIKSVEIPWLINSESAFYLIQFDFSYDDEHGLYILFKDHKAIDFFGEGDKNCDAIYFYDSWHQNKEKNTLSISIYQLDQKMIYKGSHHLEEAIPYTLKVGTYRMFVQYNHYSFRHIFDIENDTETFNLKALFSL